MAKSDLIKWNVINQNKLSAKFVFHEIEVEGIFTFNEKNYAISFEAMRYNDEHKGYYPWIVEIDPKSYLNKGGVIIPLNAQVSWVVDHKKFTWLNVEVDNYSY